MTLSEAFSENFYWSRFCIYGLFAVILIASLVGCVYVAVRLTKTILHYVPISYKSIVQKLIKTHIGTGEEACQMLAMILRKAGELGHNVRFVRTGTSASADGKRIIIPFHYLMECFALHETSEAETYIAYVLRHESAHLAYDKNKHGRCRYPLIATRKNKFYTWISEVRADFKGIEDNPEETLLTLKTIKNIETVWDCKKLSCEDSQHPSWVRRFWYLETFSSFNEYLWMQIAEDCGYRITEEDIGRIKTVSEMEYDFTSLIPDASSEDDVLRTEIVELDAIRASR